jgi:hypothetical protein
VIESINYSNAPVSPPIIIDEGCDLPLTTYDYSDVPTFLLGTHKLVISSDQGGIYPVKTLQEGPLLIITTTTIAFQIPAIENTLKPGKYFFEDRSDEGDNGHIALRGTIIVNKVQAKR